MKIYLAGPDVFRPDVEAWANSARELCRQYGFEALTPLDHCETEPRQICEGNLELIRKAQMVVANLNPFRGAEPDSGTVFELGYGFALGKKVWGYVASGESLLERVSRLVGQTVVDGEPHPTDAQGLLIENFGLPLNLMLAMSTQIITGDLAACVAAIRPRRVTTDAGGGGGYRNSG
ncbi:MAG: nucleoside 2-deoxyribosyltransferase [Sulfuritalea sp.]|jgi:nucleoside 2-deoxyribosyltransferase|nr:nucleoside 2-deoxyribosyltransferase [Sulfuritalea sp.]